MSNVRGHVLRVAIAAFMLASGNVFAIDSLEFQLYGIAANGKTYDIRPYGENSYSEGDVDEPDGIHGEFFDYIGSAPNESNQSIGSCRVRHKAPYTFSCASGRSAMSGVVYEGKRLKDPRLHPEARKLYRSFLGRYEYGALAALYRCKVGCTAERPTYLIFVWRGD